MFKLLIRWSLFLQYLAQQIQKTPVTGMLMPWARVIAELFEDHQKSYRTVNQSWLIRESVK